MTNQSTAPLANPGDWVSKGYDSFMIREKELNKQTEGTGSALQQGLQVTQFPDSSIDASSIKAGSLIGDFKVADGSVSSRDYKRDGTGWSINSDGTTDGFATSNTERFLNFSLFGSDEPVLVGDGTFGILIPSGMDNMALTEVIAAVYTNGSENDTSIQIRRRRGTDEVDMLNSNLIISFDGGNDGDTNDVDPNNDDIQASDLLYVDVDAVATDALGLSVVLTFEIP